MRKWPTILIPLVIAAIAQAQTNVLSIEQKMSRIMIPSIEFRQTDPVQALSFLIEASTSEPPTNAPCLGLIQTNAQTMQSKSYAFQLEDGTHLVLPALTIECHHISLLDAIGIVTKQLGLTFRFEHDKLVLFTKDGKRIIRKENVEQGDGD